MDMSGSERTKNEETEQLNCDMVTTKSQQTSGSSELRWPF